MCFDHGKMTVPVSAPLRCAGAHGSGAGREGEVPPATLDLGPTTPPALTPCQVMGFSPAGVGTCVACTSTWALCSVCQYNVLLLYFLLRFLVSVLYIDVYRLYLNCLLNSK